MKFIDRAVIVMKGGNGGSGAVSFRREKYVPLGGPDGGDGGRGGSIVLVGNEGMNTLYDIRYRQTISAEKGAPGGGQKRYGKKGYNEIVHIPAGTFVYDDETGELIADITEHGQEIIIAEGGIGGRGNAKFKTSTNKAPHYAQDGLPGTIRRIRLELKLLADVGIIGYPSVGKSTLIAKISNARPKIAEYHFTTLVPNLGLVESHAFPPFIVADIPGLIEGAHKGEGLGHRFLRHVERSRILIHMVEITPKRNSPVEDIDSINRELDLFNKDLSLRDQVIVLNKVDTLTESDKELREELQERVGHLPFFEISAVTGEGVDALIHFVAHKVKKSRISKEERSDQRIIDRYT
ncbi:GTPase ObgE [bacterium]|nr:GTPase ObgE [bacterium]